MPSNEQRRAAAKRKLERQLANRAQRARKRKQLTIAASTLGVVVAVAAGVGIYFWAKSDDNSTTAAKDTPEASLASAPPKAKAKPAAVNCGYRDSQQPADRPVAKPNGENVSTTAQPQHVTLQTSQGAIGLTMDAAASPCTVNSFETLAKEKFFDGTSCHRLTTGEGLKVLQCGDPTGTGNGGPGYEFDNEYPTDQYSAQDPAMQTPVAYKRGVIAMANANYGVGSTGIDGKGTNGSQFFLVYGDSQLPPQYTIFGTIDDAGLATLDKVAGQGARGGAPDGSPNAVVNIESVGIN
ncbi:peptidylprolyl isomerase [Nocardia yamanashiensis]|uniref:peptidylprolyl isomerase n=1 Tax=Nocardia yamanashiensis TaxID=209247 RepID=UPI001E3BDB2C|nr:peptidylprolyl isomerase [Nocardia yamanashiensis]UGT43011.1 peptidylprolyl isomerase [Nocardia yamanashiensis]